MAHRGGAALAPENTLAAFRAAVDLWDADVLEMDVHLTRDDELAVIHDATVDRTCDGAGAVADLEWAAIREMDASRGFRDASGREWAGEAVRVPLLDEVLEAFPATRMNVDAKVPRAAPALAETVRRHGAEHRVLMASAVRAGSARRQRYPGPGSATRRQIARFYYLHRFVPRALYTPATDALQVPDVWQGRRVVTPAFVRAAHRRNLPVHVWVVDRPHDMQRLLSWGVDGIQTDRPDRLARVLAEETGRPLPPGLDGSGPG